MSNINHKFTKPIALGQRLKFLIHENKWTQSKFAKKIGVSNTIVSKYISDEKNPSLDTLVLISDTLNTSTDYLLGKTDYVTPEYDEVAFANKFNLSPEALTSLVDHFNCFKEFAELLNYPKVNEFIEEFLKADVVPDLILSAFIICLKNDKMDVYNLANNKIDSDINCHLEALDKYYLPFCKHILNGTELVPNEIINNFSNKFTLAFSENEKEKVNHATSISAAGDALRIINNPVGKNLFMHDCKCISSYVQETLPDKVGDIAKELIKEQVRKKFYRKKE